MHMKEDHMRNSQLKPGYNVQIGVTDEYILHLDISSERNDYKTFIPFLEGFKRIITSILNIRYQIVDRVDKLIIDI